MSHSLRQPLRVCFVVSYFHPFASGAERQALAQASRTRAPWACRARGHSAVPGYPIDDEDYQGILIHRCVHTWNRGPLFA